jgi:hypothetical protein
MKEGHCMKGTLTDSCEEGGIVWMSEEADTRVVFNYKYDKKDRITYES